MHPPLNDEPAPGSNDNYCSKAAVKDKRFLKDGMQLLLHIRIIKTLNLWDAFKLTLSPVVKRWPH